MIPASDSSGRINIQWAFKLIHYFALQGIYHAVISPGSRSTPLALACELHPEIKTWLQIDERSGGFFALGLAQKKHQPVLLICTSGSAVTNWFPAVVEAAHSYTPLILLSADRPQELQNCGANQTIQQNYLFTSYVRDFIALKHADKALLNGHYLQQISSRAYNNSLHTKPGPVHINIPFREPLLPQCKTAKSLNNTIQQLTQQILTDNTTIDSSQPLTNTAVNKKNLKAIIKIINSGNGLIICGRLNQQEQRDFTPTVSLLAEQLHCPILVDPLSNLRFNTSSQNTVYNYDHSLKQSIVPKPEWIIRFGQFPVSKALLNYLQSLNSTTILISSYGDTLDPIHSANSVLTMLPVEFCNAIVNNSVTARSKDWLTHWQQIEQQAEKKIAQSLSSAANNTHFFEGHIIHSLLKHIPDKSILFSANSMAIRDFDTFITHSSASGKQLDFFANRGTSGIDGNVSTFFGLLASQSHYAIALLGDLSFYHDMNGLLIARQLAASGYNATIIVVNNNGGGIFNYLPQHQLDNFDKLWKTEINLDFQHSARLYGLGYHRIENQQQLEAGLSYTVQQSGIQLLEVIIDQKISVECHQQLNRKAE